MDIRPYFYTAYHAPLFAYISSMPLLVCALVHAFYIQGYPLLACVLLLGVLVTSRYIIIRAQKLLTADHYQLTRLRALLWLAALIIICLAGLVMTALFSITSLLILQAKDGLNAYELLFQAVTLCMLLGQLLVARYGVPVLWLLAVRLAGCKRV